MLSSRPSIAPSDRLTPESVEQPMMSEKGDGDIKKVKLDDPEKGAKVEIYVELPQLSKFKFPVPQEYASDSAPPDYADIKPFQPIGGPTRTEPTTDDTGHPNNIPANDIRPDLRSFDLMKSSIREMKDCHAVFNGLVEGIEKRHSFFPMDETEKDVYGRVLTLRSNSDSVLRTCDDLAQSCKSFAAAFERRLSQIARNGGGNLLPDDELTENGKDLLRMSDDMSTHVKSMLTNLHDLTRFIQSTKDSGRSSLRKKIWDWLVRAFKALKRIFLTGAHAVIAPVRLIVGTSVTSAASSLCMTITSGCEEDDGFEKVLTFMQREIPAAAARAEKHLTSFQAYQKILQGPLGVGESKSLVRMDQKEATDARREWYSAVVRLDDIKN